MAFRINTITNLGYFPNLQRLDVRYNNLTNIDISQNTNLERLNLNDNNFTEEFINNLVLPGLLTTLYLNGLGIINFNPTIALPSGLTSLSLSFNQIVNFDPTLPNTLTELYLNDNQIVTFNPSIALPSGLQYLDLRNNQIVSFNPSVPLPSLLLSLTLIDNQMTTAGYTASEPWANAMSVIPSRGNIYIYSNINSASGTNLETILIAKGWSVNV